MLSDVYLIMNMIQYVCLCFWISFLHNFNYILHVTICLTVNSFVLGCIVGNTETYCIALYCIGIGAIYSYIALALVLWRKSLYRQGLVVFCPFFLGFFFVFLFMTVVGFWRKFTSAFLSLQNSFAYCIY